jgi:beta-glucosidase
MIKAVLAARSVSGRPMAAKSVLVLKDNAGVAMDPALVGPHGPAILEAWFPGQEDGNIVADLLLGTANPSGKLPVTFPYVGKGFLNAVTPSQFPGLPGADGKAQTVTYAERLHIGYRWYDANISDKCAVAGGRNPCVAFPFGHGLSYTSFTMAQPRLIADPAGSAWRVATRVRNTGPRSGAEVVQVYLSLPAAANHLGAVQPPKRLVGFQKIELAAGASQDIAIAIDPAASNHPLSVWSEAEGKWVMPQGTYKVWLGRSSSPRDLKLAGAFTR